MGVARALLLTPTGVGRGWAGAPHAGTWHEGLSSHRLPRLGPGLPAPGAVWLSRLCARTANVRIVMGGAEGSRELQAGGARSMGACISVSRRPLAACCMKGTLACMQPWSSIRFRCPAARLPFPTARAGVCSSTACDLKHAPVSSGVDCGRSAAPNRGYWQLCRAVGGGARGPACRAPGSIGGVCSVAIALNTRQGTCCELCCQICLDDPPLALGPSCWYLTRQQPTLLPLRCLNDRLLAVVRLFDRLIDRSIATVLSFQLQRLWDCRWLLKGSPPSQLPDPAVRHSAASPPEQQQQQQQ